MFPNIPPGYGNRAASKTSYSSRRNDSGSQTQREALSWPQDGFSDPLNESGEWRKGYPPYAGPSDDGSRTGVKRDIMGRTNIDYETEDGIKVVGTTRGILAKFDVRGKSVMLGPYGSKEDAEKAARSHIKYG